MSEPVPGGRGWLLPLIVLVVGMFMSVLDISIVNVAIPTMQGQLGASSDEIEWITTAYTLALGVVVPASAWLGERFGMTKVYLVSLVGFAAASALCGLAWDLGSMIGFRIVQAVPGGVLPVTTMAMVYRIVPREKIGSAMGIYGLGVIFAPAIGPTLGGYLVQYVDWRLIFYINVPVGLLGALAGWLWLPRLPSERVRAFDWWGFLSAGTGLFSLLLATSEGSSWGWTSYRILILFTVSGLSLALFAVLALERDEPLIDVRVLRNRTFVNSLVLISVLSVGLYSVLFYLPLFMQASQGIEPLRAGLILMPEALVMAVCMPIAGKLYDRVGPRIPGVIGLAVACWGGYLLCGISPEMSQGDVVLWTCIRAAGNGLAMMPLMTAGMAAIPADQTASAALVNNVIQRASAALGLAVMTVLATEQQSQLMADRSALMTDADSRLQPYGLSPADLAGYLGYFREASVRAVAQAYSDVFLVAAVLTAVGVGLAVVLRKPPAQPGGTPELTAGDRPDLASGEAPTLRPVEVIH